MAYFYSATTAQACIHGSEYSFEHGSHGVWGQEKVDEKTAYETERGYSRAASGDGEMERFEEGGQEVC